MPLTLKPQKNSDLSVFYHALADILDILLSDKESVSLQYIDKFMAQKQPLKKQLLALEKIKYPIKDIKKQKYNLNHILNKHPYEYSLYSTKKYKPNKKYWIVFNFERLEEPTYLELKMSIARSNTAKDLHKKYDYIFPYPLTKINQEDAPAKRDALISYNVDFYIQFKGFKNFLNDPAVYNEFIQNPNRKTIDHPLLVKTFTNAYYAGYFLRFLTSFKSYIQYSE